MKKVMPASGKNGSAKEVNGWTSEAAVLKRYSAASETREAALCCPVNYDTTYLKALPREILEKDYGCGDPTPYVREGDHVLDLGSGGGKICFIASQIVGKMGRVIGVDFNRDMLDLARKHQRRVASRVGWNNVRFHRARIQDLRTDLDALDAKISRNALRTGDDYMTFAQAQKEMAERRPFIPDESIDVILSNCVLNLVTPEDKDALFREMFRVLRRGGRVAISDIVSDEEVPQDMKQDPALWSGCISGAFQEKAFLEAFEKAGFYGIRMEKRDEKPWRVVRGIEFRSVLVTAYKGKEGVCLERNQAAIYRGPWKEVQDDDHHVFRRGVPTAVCDKTFNILSKAPYRDEMALVPSRVAVPFAKAKPFDCDRSAERHPRETKGLRYKASTRKASVCMDGGCC